MAIFFRGLNDREGLRFLDAMIQSGKRLDFKHIPCVKVDKHSTGGVGDKTSLIVAPVVAAAGLAVPMISGRALGHTGGTLDKLESIQGMKVNLEVEEFDRVLRTHGCAFGAQTDEIVPADRKLYALRDVTSTVAIPQLIAASILSKKIAEGTDALVMDVKIGPGGFLEDEQDARDLAQKLVTWSKHYRVRTIAYGTDMHEPLGRTAGNGVEVAECLEVLSTGTGDERLLELCELLGGTMLWLGGVSESVENGRRKFNDILLSGKGYSRFCEIAEAQGASTRAWSQFASGYPALFKREIRAETDGIVREINPRDIGLALVEIGAGRRIANAAIDHTAGIEFCVKRGDKVHAGDLLAVMQWSNPDVNVSACLLQIQKAFEIGEESSPPRPLKYFEIN